MAKAYRRRQNWFGPRGQEKLNPKLADSIGRFMIAWSWLETHLDSAYAHLFQVEEPLALCLTANLGTRTKLDTISSTVAMLKSAFPENR